jgi:hypothetical protein
MPEAKKGRASRAYGSPKTSSLPKRGERTATNKERKKEQPKKPMKMGK